MTPTSFLPGTPLDPSPDEARSLLRRELLHPDYQQDLLQRLVTWLGRLVDRGLAAAADAPPLQVLVAMVVALALVLALGWLASRARGGAAAPRRSATVLGERGVTAAELRARAEAALAAGHCAPALLDAFRALAVDQVERGHLEDRPGATAHEVAELLAAGHPTLRTRVLEAGRLFDAVCYGHRTASPEQAAGVLALGDELAVRR